MEYFTYTHVPRSGLLVTWLRRLPFACRLVIHVIPWWSLPSAVGGLCHLRLWRIQCNVRFYESRVVVFMSTILLLAYGSWANIHFYEMRVMFFSHDLSLDTMFAPIDSWNIPAPMNRMDVICSCGHERFVSHYDTWSVWFLFVIHERHFLLWSQFNAFPTNSWKYLLLWSVWVSSAPMVMGVSLAPMMRMGDGYDRFMGDIGYMIHGCHYLLRSQNGACCHKFIEKPASTFMGVC